MNLKPSYIILSAATFFLVPLPFNSKAPVQFEPSLPVTPPFSDVVALRGALSFSPSQQYTIFTVPQGANLLVTDAEWNGSVFVELDQSSPSDLRRPDSLLQSGSQNPDGNSSSFHSVVGLKFDGESSIVLKNPHQISGSGEYSIIGYLVSSEAPKCFSYASVVNSQGEVAFSSTVSVISVYTVPPGKDLFLTDLEWISTSPFGNRNVLFEYEKNAATVEMRGARLAEGLLSVGNTSSFHSPVGLPIPSGAVIRMRKTSGDPEGQYSLVGYLKTKKTRTSPPP